MEEKQRPVAAKCGSFSIEEILSTSSYDNANVNCYQLSSLEIGSAESEASSVIHKGQGTVNIDKKRRFVQGNKKILPEIDSKLLWSVLIFCGVNGSVTLLLSAWEIFLHVTFQRLSNDSKY